MTPTAMRSIRSMRARKRGGIRQEGPIRLGVLLTHPVQYYSPWFEDLSHRPELDLRVIYARRPDAAAQGEGFGVPFEWDAPLLDGYRYSFIGDAPLRTLIRNAGREVWLIPGWGDPIYRRALFECSLAGLPVLARGDSNLLAPRKPLARVVKRAALGLALPRFAACLAVGRRSREYYLHYGVDPRRIHESPHFVDNRAFAEAANRARENRGLLRARWGIPADRVTFLFCGKFQDQTADPWRVGAAVKRPMDLLRALATLNEAARGHAHALMIGDGESRAACERFARAARLNSTFAGFLNQSRIAEAYAAADVLVLPSSVETWGLVVNEAMACGLPAIVSDQVGCAPDLIREGVTGDVFPCGDAAALAEKLARYINQPGRAAMMGRLAREHVTTTHTMEAATAGLLTACRSALGIAL